MCSSDLARLAYADRFEYMADPEFADVPWKGMVSDAYTDIRRAGIDASTLGGIAPGDPWALEGRRPTEILESSAPALDRGTTHLDRKSVV